MGRKRGQKSPRTFVGDAPCVPRVPPHRIGGGPVTRLNGRQKGARGEREAAKFASEKWGSVNARRACQIGVPGGRDVDHVLPGCRVEVKRVEKLDVAKAHRQASRDAGPDETPVVMHRVNRKPWMLTVDLRDLVRLAEAYAAIDGRTIYPGGREVLVSIRADELEEVASIVARLLGRPVYPFPKGGGS